MYYVYVLMSGRDGKHYIGCTSDLKRRFYEHQVGNVSSTKDRRPLQLVYYEAHTSRMDVMRREGYYKTAKGKSTLRQVLRDSLKQVQL